MTNLQMTSLLRQMVHEQRAVKAAMQKKAFTLMELGVAAPLLAATGYGAYKTHQRMAANPDAGKRGRTGAAVGGVAGAALPVVLSLLSRGRIKPSLTGSAASGLLGAGAGTTIGAWTAPNKA